MALPAGSYLGMPAERPVWPWSVIGLGVLLVGLGAWALSRR